MGQADRSKGRRGVVRSVAEIAAVSLDEMLDGREEGAAVLLSMTPWKRHCRRLVRHVLAEV
jgi:hypothetical protein